MFVDEITTEVLVKRRPKNGSMRLNRFTPRDQLSFAYTYMKLRMNPDKPFHLHMFKVQGLTCCFLR